MKHNNICIIRASEGGESEQGIKNLFEEIMTENFLNLVKKKNTQVQEVQRIPNKIEQKTTPKHIIIKMAKLIDKERILNAKKERQVVNYKEAPLKLPSDFSTGTFRPEGIAMK